MECIDDYAHTAPHIMYFPKCIPTKEVEETIKPSPIFCNCSTTCDEASNCVCTKQSGTSYTFTNIKDLESYQLNYKNVNRPTYECNEQCRCLNHSCGNKLVQGGPRRGLKVQRCQNPLKGEGVFTERPIKKGNFVCEYAGEIISEREASVRYKINARHKRMNYIFCVDEYFGENNLKTFIDPSFYGNIGRYVNHSCEPNCIMIIGRINDNIPVLALFACKDIAVGEELSYDYGIVDRSETNDATKCLCESDKCKGFLPYDTRIM